MALLRHPLAHHGKDVLNDVTRQQIGGSGGICRGIGDVALAAVGMAQVGVDREYLADKSLATFVHDELDRVVRAEHVSGLQRNVPRAADVRHFLESLEREAEGLVHVHRDSGLRAFERHVDQLLVGDLDDGDVRLHLVYDLLGREARKPLVVLHVRLAHAHDFRGCIVDYAYDLVVVLQFLHRLELAERVVVRDAP